MTATRLVMPVLLFAMVYSFVFAVSWAVETDRSENADLRACAKKSLRTSCWFFAGFFLAGALEVLFQ